MENKKSLPLVLVLGLPIILIVSTFMARLHIEIGSSPLYISTFLYPLTYLLICLIIKKTNSKNAFNIMSVALISQSLAFIIEWIMLNKMDCYVMICTFLSFLFSQLILIYTYDFLRKTKKDGYFAILLLIGIVSAIDNAFFGACIEGQTISLSILVRLVYVIIIPLVLAEKK